ncbi:hypothetical protein X777_13830 [Ooceraea biroi]|uniref:Uncharacterized protein n=1 Tax=Ooceraea biroi TaxID=2015173 RepID=A0A026VXW6_OOCBI|nr:hypothetical protein X777_13830 [Ooceraea biroi]
MDLALTLPINNFICIYIFALYIDNRNETRFLNRRQASASILASENEDGKRSYEYF